MPKVNIQGKDVEAEEIGFQSRKEEWNEYILDDGSTVKIKLVATNIFKTDQVDQQGTPIYLVKSQNIMTVTPLKKLKKEQIQ
ncbi:hypothetical protein MYX65_07430 [Acidobacteria bacterium AH-259-L09]|nr:hypothetical protein [Acidobacteria bacterium AH-259-L09]